MSIFNPDLM